MQMAFTLLTREMAALHLEAKKQNKKTVGVESTLSWLITSTVLNAIKHGVTLGARCAP